MLSVPCFPVAVATYPLRGVKFARGLLFVAVFMWLLQAFVASRLF
jgi:hypothetical protein